MKILVIAIGGAIGSVLTAGLCGLIVFPQDSRHRYRRIAPWSSIAWGYGMLLLLLFWLFGSRPWLAGLVWGGVGLASMTLYVGWVGNWKWFRGSR